MGFWSKKPELEGEGVPAPLAPLRQLKIPHWDTVSIPVVDGIPQAETLFFVNPMGTDKSGGGVKTWADTSMTVSSRLPAPQEFAFHALKCEMDPLDNVEDRLKLYFNSHFQWSFEGHKPWFSAPLSYIPCAFFMSDGSPERWKRILLDGRTWWDALEVLERSGIKPSVYGGRETVDLTVSRKPLKLRPQDSFSGKISIDHDDWENRRLRIEADRVTLRIYMMGIMSCCTDLGEAPADETP